MTKPGPVRVSIRRHIGAPDRMFDANGAGPWRTFLARRLRVGLRRVELSDADGLAVFMMIDAQHGVFDRSRVVRWLVTSEEAGARRDALRTTAKTGSSAIHHSGSGFRPMVRRTVTAIVDLAMDHPEDLTDWAARSVAELHRAISHWWLNQQELELAAVQSAPPLERAELARLARHHLAGLEWLTARLDEEAEVLRRTHEDGWPADLPGAPLAAQLS